MMRSPLHYAFLLYDGSDPIVQLLTKSCAESAECADVVSVDRCVRIRYRKLILIEASATVNSECLILRLWERLQNIGLH